VFMQPMGGLRVVGGVGDLVSNRAEARKKGGNAKLALEDGVSRNGPTLSNVGKDHKGKRRGRVNKPRLKKKLSRHGTLFKLWETGGEGGPPIIRGTRGN